MSELGPGTLLDGFSVKNSGGYANFQPQRSSERQLAIFGLVRLSQLENRHGPVRSMAKILVRSGSGTSP